MNSPVIEIGEIAVFDVVVIGTHQIDPVPLVVRSYMPHDAGIGVSQEYSASVIILRLSPALINDGADGQIRIAAEIAICNPHSMAFFH